MVVSMAGALSIVVSTGASTGVGALIGASDSTFVTFAFVSNGLKSKIRD